MNYRKSAIALTNVKGVNTFSTTVSNEVLENLDEREKQRQGVIFELIDSEIQYNRDIDVIIRVYLHPIKSQSLLTREEIGALFSNIEAIYELNQSFLRDLQKLQGTSSSSSGMINEIGPLLFSWSDKFKVYLPYCSNHMNLLEKISTYTKKYPRFSAFMDASFALPESRLLSLDSFLIAPLQRICKYPLLLHKLLHATPETHPDWEYLRKAYEELNTTVEMVNERTRQIENIEKLMTIQSKLESDDDDEINLVSTKRFLVRESSLVLKVDSKRKDIQAFLFNDLLLICKEEKKGMYKLRKKIPLETITLKNNNNNAETVFFEMTISPPHTTGSQESGGGGGGEAYIFEAGSFAEAAGWVSDLTQYIESNSPLVKRKCTIVTLPSVTGVLEDSGSVLSSSGSLAGSTSSTTSTTTTMEHQRKERNRSFTANNKDNRGSSFRSLVSFFAPSSSSSSSPSDGGQAKKGSFTADGSTTPGDNTSSSEGGSFTLSQDAEGSTTTDASADDGPAGKPFVSPEAMIKDSLAAELRLRAEAEKKAAEVREELEEMKRRYNHLRGKLEKEEKRKKEKLNNERLKDEMRKTEKLRNENEDLRKEKRKLQHDLAYEVEQNKYLKSHMDMLQQTASTHKQLVELYNRQLAQLKGARPDESVPIGN